MLLRFAVVDVSKISQLADADLRQRFERGCLPALRRIRLRLRHVRRVADIRSLLQCMTELQAVEVDLGHMLSDMRAYTERSTGSPNDAGLAFLQNSRFASGFDRLGRQPHKGKLQSIVDVWNESGRRFRLSSTFNFFSLALLFDPSERLIAQHKEWVSGCF